MERSLVIRLGIAASILVHLLVVAVIFLSTDVRQYEQAAPEDVAVDIVDADEPEKPEPVPSPSPSSDLTLADRFSTSSSSAAPAQQPPQPPATREAAAQPQPQQQPPQAQPPQPQQAQPPQPQQAQSPQPQQPQQPSPSPAPSSTPSQSQGYIPAQPDITVKYGVMLGLPDPLSLSGAPGGKPEEGLGAGPSATSSLATSLVAALRSHLRSCSRLPPSVKPSDNVMVKLRVMMTPDGRLAAEPDLLEVKSPLKGVDLKQAAARALTACQPYTMLPADRYGEWKMLELSFTPQDFGG
jgi:hypothetical protein